ncbi:site-specific integrase [Prosthecodimorpha staleyi]|uniref:Site-specific integrase n=1 Tax=Prosthecodimorpha staleyi TaxID=2840188 RepID=A0A947D8B8_9HYPH|nr:site-specific integrase [Prosthecodimorpha staleyi]MBT9292965.1 site-specific integrase [Prosthecodimorpha staleyi]
MAAVKITKRVVDAAEPKLSRYVVFDSEIRGFGLRVFPSGQKSWIFEYRAGDGGRRAAKKRITIGSISDFTPDQARKQADTLRSQTKVGHDPQAAKVESRKAITVAELVKIFLTDHVEAKRKSRTKEHYEDILCRIVVPAIGAKRAKDLKRSDVAQIHLDWRHTPAQANRVLAIIGSMYGFGARHGLVPDDCNPARRIERFVEHRRERFLTTEELSRLGEAIREAETVGIPWDIDTTKKTKHVPKIRQATPIGAHAAAALRLLIFTGARLREILGLRWSEVDFERGLLLLPDSKTGRKTIILNAPALRVLSELPRIGGYVIAGGTAGLDGERPRSDLKRPWAVVAQRAGLNGIRLHDLRHTFASIGAGGGLGLPIVGKLLGHAHTATTARYAHLDADPLKRASDTIGSVIASAMEGKPADNLLKFR